MAMQTATSGPIAEYEMLKSLNLQVWIQTTMTRTRLFTIRRQDRLSHTTESTVRFHFLYIIGTHMMALTTMTAPVVGHTPA
jgi:hypothetical protein